MWSLGIFFRGKKLFRKQICHIIIQNSHLELNTTVNYGEAELFNESDLQQGKLISGHMAKRKHTLEFKGN